jgi:2-C-methyl-D-erythritol 2,4-cyclodiphosphate synthase
MRIGHGYDAHRFGGEDPLMLGGVHVPYAQGLIAHSDGDVVLHALCDALLGAAALGDIGRHFPDSDSQYQNIDSRVLLRRVVSALADLNMSTANADITIIAQAPRLSAYIDAMRGCIAEDLGVDSAFVNVKATTTEKMGWIGREEGIGTHAVVLLTSNS